MPILSAMMFRVPEKTFALTNISPLPRLGRSLALPSFHQFAYGSVKLSIRQKPCELSNRTGTAIGPDCWDLTRRISCQ